MHIRHYVRFEFHKQTPELYLVIAEESSRIDALLLIGTREAGASDWECVGPLVVCHIQLNSLMARGRPTTASEIFQVWAVLAIG